MSEVVDLLHVFEFMDFLVNVLPFDRSHTLRLNNQERRKRFHPGDRPFTTVSLILKLNLW
ncbi:MAG: hypothetical protein A4S15_08990 [Candidatus Raskinella chloraquaticus]|uniref:Uncharacterized protein n=1 Tax=Candidatus Raskinella chloraquaticus TaxID=1951219 RepID=A0A1W9HX58_9HYPH|nr:MAG: hypothetical protein A4S15_08990 [Proteobacteria bacterium SG_bin8]